MFLLASTKSPSIKYDCYTDDTQVYMTLRPFNKWDAITSSIEARIANISIRINHNMLKLNKNNTKLIIYHQYTNDESCKDLVQVLIISGLDYGSVSLINRLQRVQ